MHLFSHQDAKKIIKFRVPLENARNTSVADQIEGCGSKALDVHFEAIVAKRAANHIVYNVIGVKDSICSSKIYNSSLNCIKMSRKEDE